MKEYLLKEIANVKNGYAFDSSKYSDKGIPIIRIADIKDNIDLSKCVCIDEEINEEFLIKKGSLLIALSGATTGKMGVFSDNKIAYLNQRICSIYTKNKDISQEFLIYFLKSIQKKIIVNSYGGAQPNISSRWVENIKIKVPNIEIQKKISKKLELLTNNINSRKSQLVFLNELIKSLFTRMFGDIKTNDKNWKIESLDNIYWIRSSKRVFEKDYKKDGIPFFRSKEVVGLSQSKNINPDIYISLDKYEELKKISGIPLKDDLLVTAVGTIGKIWKVDYEKEFYFKDGNLIWLQLKKPHNFFNPLSLKKILEEFLNKEKENLSSGSAYNALTIDKLKKFSIFIPPIELQNKFAERVEKIEKLKFIKKKSLFSIKNREVVA